MADALPSELSKVDPADAWKPWQPSAAAPWNKKWVAHLYRRAAFGPSPADTDRALADGFPKTLDRLLAGDPNAAANLEMIVDTGRYVSGPLQLRAWWLYAMIESGHPLREKLTLFWHNHFATSYTKVQNSRLMFEQNLTLRKHALGKFPAFLLDMSRDTAMLIWLDSNQNVAGAPNENYAREVMELFSLGVGNYTEKDIKEAARAFTGWHHDVEQTRFEYKPELHDDGPKTVLGRTGNLNGDDVVRICTEQPACARFLVGKMYTFLVSETPPPKGLLEPLEERYRKSGYDTADLVRAVLGSRLFFSEHAYRRRVKWPVEYALGAARAVVPGRVPLGDVAEPLAKMGQVLFAPPNVKGWRAGTDWLNSATLLARNNFAESVATGQWKRTNVRNPGDTALVKEGTPADVPATPVPDGLVLVGPPGMQTLIGPPEQVQAAAGALGAAGVYGISPMGGPEGEVPPLPPAGVGTVAKPTQPGKKDGGPAPPADAKLDPAVVLFATKPESVKALVTRMGELLYGEQVPPTARAKVEKFLLDGKATVTAKDMESAAFKQRAREALHALMCLPEYQLC
jgi:hypothetical protein